MENETVVNENVTQETSDTEQWLESRKADLSELFTPPEENLESTTESTGDTDTNEQKAVPAAEEAPAEESTSLSQGLRALLEQQEEFNKSKESWSQERAEFERQRQEFDSQIQALQKAKQLLAVNPGKFFEMLGIEKERLPEIARNAYYEYLDEDAPDEYRSQKANSHLYDELNELKQLVKQQQEMITADRYEKERAAYQNEISTYVGSASKENPELAVLVDAYGNDAVASGLYNIAEIAARQPGANRVLTPEECADILVEQYKPILGKTAPNVTPKKVEQKPASDNSVVLRNSDTAIQDDFPDLSEFNKPDAGRAEYDKLRELARRRAKKHLDAFYSKG